jgi:hypothetical protein
MPEKQMKGDRRATVLIVAAIALAVAGATVILSSAAWAGGGGGGLGITFGTANPYRGPYYSTHEDAGGCVWKRQLFVDHRGRRVSKRVRVCY